MPVAVEKIVQAIEAAKRFAKENRIRTYKPYDFQRAFHEAGKDHPERMLRAANRTGKTWCAASEVSYHATGDYPDDWEGKRFDEPCLIWTGSPTNETSRDIVQTELFGGDGALGTGTIPKSKIIGRPKTKQCGISNVFETVQVRHVRGISRVMLKTYEQGWTKWQGTAPHVVWLDEEPCKGAFPTTEDYKIFTEAQTRILTSDGIIMVTFTPLNGMTPLVEHFDEDIPGVFLIGATWEDAPHLKPEDKERLRASYPDYEVQARTMGVPMMGEGRVFTVSEDAIKCEPFEIPRYYARLGGIDFGIDHPFGFAEIAWDRDKDIIYVTDAYKVKGETPVYHTLAVSKRTEAFIAWPHDGVNKDKGSGKPLFTIYREAGMKLLGKSACYPKMAGDRAEKAGAQPQEPVILEILERMKSGRFKVFANLEPWFEEFRSYHRKDGRLVARRDDVLKATFYAVMMKRYASPIGGPRIRRSQSAPLRIAR